jgi:hypothetical protein
VPVEHIKSLLINGVYVRGKKVYCAKFGEKGQEEGQAVVAAFIRRSKPTLDGDAVVDLKREVV